MITNMLLTAMGATGNRALTYAPHLSAAAAEFGIVEPLDIAHWLAQIFQESGALKYVRELWDGKGQQARYDTRTDLGNTPQVDGDGYHNRGVGLIQTTGEYNIEKALKALGYPPDSNDNLATPEGASRSAGYFWHSNGLTAIALSSGFDVHRCTKRVNGGYTHLTERQAYFDKARRFLEIGADAQTTPPDQVSVPKSTPPTQHNEVVTKVEPVARKPEVVKPKDDVVDKSKPDYRRYL